MIRTRLIVWRLALLAGALCCSARANGDEPAAAATSAATVRKEDAPAAAAPYGEQPILAVDAGGHTGRIDRLVLSAYGDQLISISHDKTIRFWDVNSGEPLRVLRPAIGDGLEGQLYSVALSPDGSKLAVGGFRALTPVNDHRVLVISLPDGQLLYRLKGHLGPIRGLAFSPDGSRLASASQDHTLRLWNMETGGAVASLTGHLDYVLSLAWSPDGKRLVSGAWDRTARVWSVESGKTEAVLTGHARDVLSVAWSRDGRTIATGAADKSIRLWEPNGVFRFAWHNLDNDVQMVAFSEDATQLLYSWGSRENSVHGTAILDLKDGHERSRFTGHSNTPMAGVLLSGGTLAATAGAPGDICLWNTTSGKLERRLSSRGQSVAAVGWSTDGRAIAWGHSYTGNMARGTNPLERTFCLETLTFGAAPDASFFTTRSTHEDLGIERVSERRAAVRRNGRVISRLEIPDIGDKIRCRTLLSERRAILGTNLRLYQFNIDTGTQTRWLVGHTDTIHAIAPSGDFRYLLSGGVDQTLRIWKLATGELLLTLFFAGDEWIAWTPQGYYAASLGGEGLMGWHLNGTGDSMASFYPASRFHKTLYRPDVIRGLLAHGTLAQALAAADRERARASEPIILSAALPPTVTLMTPAEQKVTLTEPTITIRARAAPAGPDPITSMRLIVNGRPGERKQRAAPPADTDAGVA